MYKHLKPITTGAITLLEPLRSGYEKGLKGAGFRLSTPTLLCIEEKAASLKWNGESQTNPDGHDDGVIAQIIEDQGLKLLSVENYGTSRVGRGRVRCRSR